MVEIRVWSPTAARLDAHVVGEASPRPLTRVDDEHFSIDLPAGTRYLLSVDGGEPRPDPRSRRQPEGVHGPSEVVDPGSFGWTDDAWAGLDVLGRVIYELHVGTFTPEGTLDAAIDRLDHLAGLGVEVVELMPLAAFPGVRGWGYDGVALYAVHEPYGGPEALVRFVDAAHSRGLAVCLDVVYNHFGPSGNYTGTFGPYLSDKHESPWGLGVNVDGEHSRGVRDFIIDNACGWLRDFHLDALRLDAVHALVDDSTPHILAELSDAVATLEDELGRPCSLIAESDLNDARMVTPTSEGGLGMDAQWADDVHHALHAYLTGETFGYYVDFGTPEALDAALTQVFVHAGTFSTFRGKDWGAPVPQTLDRRRFVVFSENHDQVGNRGLGDRPGALHGRAVLAASAAVILLGPYTPMLFQGQEWGAETPFQFFTDHDTELGKLVTEGRTREFGEHGWDVLYGNDLVVPDPQAETTWRESQLKWSELDADPARSLLAWHRDLIALRRELISGSSAPTAPVVTWHGDGWYAMVNGALAVVLSTGAGEATVPDVAGELIASWGEASVTSDGVILGRASVAVVRVERAV